MPVLRAAYEEIKAVDPSAKVAIGGTAGLALDYLDGVYKAGGKVFARTPLVQSECVWY